MKGNCLVIIIFGTFLYLIFYTSSTCALVSYTANGTWEKSEDGTVCDKFLCTGHNRLAFKPTTPGFRILDKAAACEALLARGIKRINFHGDSYMRQIYAAMLITLTGDFRYGSISNSTYFPHCEYQKQFLEKRCGIGQLNHYGSGCDNKIKLDPLLIGLEHFNDCRESAGTIALWSFGNHKLGKYGRQGVNNATQYQELFQSHTCPAIRDAMNWLGIDGTFNKPCSIWWVTTHNRLVAHFPDEKPELVEKYNYDMQEFFDSQKCGPVNFVDVYNMTRSLVVDHRGDAEPLSYDGVHWGMEINLMKAQIILNALLQMPVKQ